MKIGVVLEYLKLHASPIKAGHTQARAKADLVGFADEAIQEAAKILIEQREPWMFREWIFSTVAKKKDYKLYLDIAPGSEALKSVQTFGRLHSLFILSSDGGAWHRYKIMNRIEAMVDAEPLGTKPWPVAWFGLIAGHGGLQGTEGDYVLNFENPPDYDGVNNARLGVFVVPATLIPTVDINWEPALPPFAWTYVKRHALRIMYLADGNIEGYQALEKEMERAEIKLRAGSGSAISDEPEYVQDVQAEERGGVIPGGWS